MTTSQFVLAGAVVAVGVIVVLASRKRTTTGRPGLFAAEEQTHARDQLERLVAELHDVTREQIARLDTKIRMLQQLIADADVRIRELRGARPANALHDRVYALADAGKSVAQICSETNLDEGEVHLVLGLRQTAGLRPRQPTET